MNNVQNLSSVNSAFLYQKPSVPDVQVPKASAQVDNDNKSKKLFLTLAGLAIAGSVIAIGVLRHRRPDKAAQAAAQNVQKTASSGAQQTVTPKAASSNVQQAPAPAVSKPATSGVQQTVPSDTKQTAIPSVQKTQNTTAQLTGDELFKQNRLKIIEKYFPDKSNLYADRPMMLYRDIQHDFYKQIRCCKVPYPKTQTCADNIANITGTRSKNISVLNENGWHYRMSTTKINAPTIGRISLNVAPEPELIKKLDDIIVKFGGAANYKTPSCNGDWYTRHDPITIYFKRNITKAEAGEIIKAVSPHVRKADDSVMLGEKIADGIFMLPEPNEKHVQKIIDRAKALGFDDNFIRFLQDPSWLGASLYSEHSNGQKYVRTSPGLVESLNRMLDEFEQILAHVNG